MSEFRRQHPVAAITQFLTVIRQNIVTIIIVFFLGSTRSYGDWFWYFLLFGVITALIMGVFGWWKFKYRVFEEELQINKGVLVRNKLYLSKDRIQVIDVTQGDSSTYVRAGEGGGKDGRQRNADSNHQCYHPRRGGRAQERTAETEWES